MVTCKIFSWVWLCEAFSFCIRNHLRESLAGTKTVEDEGQSAAENALYMYKLVSCV